MLKRRVKVGDWVVPVRYDLFPYPIRMKFLKKTNHLDNRSATFWVACYGRDDGAVFTRTLRQIDKSLSERFRWLLSNLEREDGKKRRPLYVAAPHPEDVLLWLRGHPEEEPRPEDLGRVTRLAARHPLEAINNA